MRAGSASHGREPGPPAPCARLEGPQPRRGGLHLAAHVVETSAGDPRLVPRAPRRAAGQDERDEADRHGDGLEGGNAAGPGSGGEVGLAAHDSSPPSHAASTASSHSPGPSSPRCGRLPTDLAPQSRGVDAGDDEPERARPVAGERRRAPQLVPQPRGLAARAVAAPVAQGHERPLVKRGEAQGHVPQHRVDGVARARAHEALERQEGREVDALDLEPRRGRGLLVLGDGRPTHGGADHAAVGGGQGVDDRLRRRPGQRRGQAEAHVVARLRARGAGRGARSARGRRAGPG